MFPIIRLSRRQKRRNLSQFFFMKIVLAIFKIFRKNETKYTIFIHD